MYKCLHCGQVFERTDIRLVTENYGSSDSGNSMCMPQKEEIEVCPHCLSDDIKQLKCDVCRTNICRFDYVKAENGDRVCNDCLPIYFVDNYNGIFDEVNYG